MATLGERLDAHRGFGPGFDMLRLLLASGVVLWHCFPLTTGTPKLIEATPFWFLVSAMVPMFFALSGFLVIASAIRIPVGPFLLNRAARIVPALVVVVLAAALVMGPLVTTLPLADYFATPELRRYLVGTLGWPSYNLPGVFESNPLDGTVNGSLWTVPHEILCYLMVAALMVVGLASRWWALIGIFLGLFALAFAAEVLAPGTLPWPIEAVIRSPHFAQGSKIIPFFLLGALAYLLRHRLPIDARLAALSLVIVLLIGVLVEPSARKGALLWLASGIPLTYLVVWAGLTPLPKPNFLGGGDFSYGVYLWHFPILQLLVMAFGFTQWWALGLAAIAPVLLVSAASWHFIEKPALKLRKRYSTVGSRLAAAESTKPGHG